MWDFQLTYVTFWQCSWRGIALALQVSFTRFSYKKGGTGGASMAVLGLPVERPWLEPGGPFVFFLA